MQLKTAVILGVAAAAEARKCMDLNVPVSISSRNGVFDYMPAKTEIEATNFFLNLAQQGGNYTDDLLTGYDTIKGDYNLACTYCEPDDGPGEVLQLMTHGIGFDRSYWDLPFNNYNYSYAMEANDKGYSTFTWDRLGIGMSDHGDGVNEIQLFLEVAALQELTRRLQEGQVCGVKHKYEKIAHLGHSFGSAITYNFVNMYPDMSSGAVFTGFSQVPNYIAYFALGGNFVPSDMVAPLKGEYPPGYFAPKSSYGVHVNFFAPHDFDPEVLALAAKKGQPASVGELLTVGAGTAAKNSFAGPVFIITGERDIPFCGGDCTSTMMAGVDAPDLIAVSKPMFAQASSFDYHIVEGAGHGLNLAYSHETTYGKILDFFSSKIN